MNSQRLRLYALYGLPALGVLALLYTVFAPYRYQSPFIQLLPKLFFIAYILLDIKSVYRRMNPGVKVHQAARKEQIIRVVQVRKSWQWVAGSLRVVLFFGFIALGYLLFAMSGRPDYGWIGILILLAIIWGVGFVDYLNNPPQQILITEKGVHSYIWSYRFLAWERLNRISEKAEWISFIREGKPDHDINFEEIIGPPTGLIQAIKPQALVHQVPYEDHSQEYNPAV